MMRQKGYLLHQQTIDPLCPCMGPVEIFRVPEVRLGLNGRRSSLGKKSLTTLPYKEVCRHACQPMNRYPKNETAQSPIF